MKILNILLDFLLPPRCPLCGQVVARGESLCPGCKEKLPKAPYTRALPLAGGKSLRVVAPMPYRDEYRHALHRFKFLGKRSLAKPLGQLMAHALPKGIAADGVAFVPLWEKDRAARGYDQSGLLAKEMAACLGLPLVEALQKTRKTQVQHQLSKALRAENVRGAYRAEKPVAGRRLLLVDDIVTTGATLRACAEALYQAGAAEITAVCAANAVGDGRAE